MTTVTGAGRNPAARPRRFPWRILALCLSLLTFAAVFDSAPAAAQWYELGRGIASGLFGGGRHYFMADGTIATMLMPVTTITERGTLPSGTGTTRAGTRIIEAAGAAAVRR